LSADHLFVYGTLRRGSNNKFARLLSERAHFVGPARVSGRLYDFGSYPGARREEGSIIGEIVRLDPLGELLGVLDDYEGPEYERAVTTAHTAEGHTIDAWIYWYAKATQGKIIASGDWFVR
jgi:gamma-glutamylcyclotransferase (GGCT)/AIG2-like uncharacterized protein YtfP